MLVYRVIAQRPGQDPYSAVIGSRFVQRGGGWRFAFHRSHREGRDRRPLRRFCRRHQLLGADYPTWRSSAWERARRRYIANPATVAAVTATTNAMTLRQAESCPNSAVAMA